MCENCTILTYLLVLRDTRMKNIFKINLELKILSYFAVLETPGQNCSNKVCVCLDSSATLFQVNMYSGALFIQQSVGWNLYVSIFGLLALTGICTVTGKTNISMVFLDIYPFERLGN